MQVNYKDVTIDEGDYLALLDFARMVQYRNDEYVTVDEAVAKVAGGAWCTSLDNVNFLDSNCRVTAVEIWPWHTRPLLFDCLFGMDSLTELSFKDLNLDIIPDCFDRMPNLKDLCFWAMPRLQHLPPSICSLQKLESLRCKSCRQLRT